MFSPWSRSLVVEQQQHENADPHQSEIGLVDDAILRKISGQLIDIQLAWRLAAAHTPAIDGFVGKLEGADCSWRAGNDPGRGGKAEARWQGSRHHAPRVGSGSSGCAERVCKGPAEDDPIGERQADARS